ncbi:MAG: FtsX-like permease family protein [Bacteroidota bacterium]
MLKNYLVLAVRQLRKHTLYSSINILGLSCGVAIFLVLWCYIRFETSFNSFHSKADRLYQLNTTLYSLDMEPFTAWDVAPGLKESVPGITNIARFHWTQGTLTLKEGHEERSSTESGILFADNSIFDLFTFKPLAGNLSNALTGSYSIVLSRSAASRFFKDPMDAIGKTLALKGDWLSSDLVVTAVIEDAPDNSTLGYSSFVSIDPLINTAFYQGQCRWNNFFTYVELDDASSAQKVSEAFPRFISEYKSGEKLTYQPEMFLQPIGDIHLSHQDPRQGKDLGNIYLFMIIAVTIIAIAWVNYVNLSTARAIERAKEVGVKKALGVVRKQLVLQFMTESFMINVISMTLAIILAGLFMPVLNNLADRQLTLDLTSPDQLTVILCLLGFGTLVSGLYPAIILSSFWTVEVIKGTGASPAGGFSLRKALIVFQFTASLCLLICTSAIVQQVWFMEKQDKGGRTEQVLVVSCPVEAASIENNGEWNTAMAQRTVSLKNKLLSLPNIERVATSGVVPGGSYNQCAHIDIVGKSAEEITPGENACTIFSDFDFIDTYKMSISAGRNWDAERKTDLKRVIVNEAFVADFKLGTSADAIEKKVVWMGDTLSIVGVVKNFYWESLKVTHRPLVLLPMEVYPRRISILVNGNIEETVGKVEALYSEFYPGSEFYYYFAEDFYNRMYASDLRFGAIFGVFATFAILVACLGLFGMATFTMHQRSKEISIRKVLGASVKSIMMLLSTQFGRLLVIAIIIATPLSWYAINSWLESYPVRVGISFWMFAVPSVALLLVLAASVIVQVYRGANVNPARVLRG